MKIAVDLAFFLTPSLHEYALPSIFLRFSWWGRAGRRHVFVFDLAPKSDAFGPKFLTQPCRARSAMKAARQPGVNGRPTYLQLATINNLAGELYWRDVCQQSFTPTEFRIRIRELRREERALVDLADQYVDAPTPQQVRTIMKHANAVRIATPSMQNPHRLEVCFVVCMFSPLPPDLRSPNQRRSLTSAMP